MNEMQRQQLHSDLIPAQFILNSVAAQSKQFTAPKHSCFELSLNSEINGWNQSVIFPGIHGR